MPRIRASLVALALLAGCSFESAPEPPRELRTGTAGTGSGTSGSGSSSTSGTSGGAGAAGEAGGGGRGGTSSPPEPAIDAGTPQPRDGGLPEPADGGSRDAQAPDASRDAGTPIKCIPNLARTCYTGPAGTRGIGVCHAGTHRCLPDGSGFGACTGEVLPSADVCSNDLDDDCNGIVNDGYPDASGCECTPGDQQPCYEGPDGTLGVGACSAGAITCNDDGTGWSGCENQVVPGKPSCAVADRDCNGTSDDQQDLDGDGYTLCDGDCCDGDSNDCNGTPELVNPGAYDLAGNGMDDDCSGGIDDAASSCDGALANDTSAAQDYAKALDLCQRTTASAAGAAKRWGVISAAFALSDGTGAPADAQRFLRTAFGPIAPEHGARMVALSTGHAAATGDSEPVYEAFDPGVVMGTTSAMPSDWLAANGDAVQQIPGCAAIAKASVYDSALLGLNVRVPTNVHSFSLRVFYLTADFPEYVCSAYPDYALVLLSSALGAPSNPADGNIATFTSSGGTRYPLSVDLAYGDTGLFRQCLDGPTGCGNTGTASTTTACTGVDLLTGTGFDQSSQNPCGNDPENIGGGTGWTTISGNVQPGEIIDLRLLIWDTADAKYDSVVLFDDFRWSTETVTSGLSP